MESGRKRTFLDRLLESAASEDKKKTGRYKKRKKEPEEKHDKLKDLVLHGSVCCLWRDANLWASAENMLIDWICDHRSIITDRYDIRTMLNDIPHNKHGSNEDSRSVQELDEMRFGDLEILLKLEEAHKRDEEKRRQETKSKEIAFDYNSLQISIPAKPEEHEPPSVVNTVCTSLVQYEEEMEDEKKEIDMDFSTLNTKEQSFVIQQCANWAAKKSVSENGEVNVDWLNKLCSSLQKLLPCLTTPGPLHEKFVQIVCKVVSWHVIAKIPTFRSICPNPSCRPADMDGLWDVLFIAQLIYLYPPTENILKDQFDFVSPSHPLNPLLKSFMKLIDTPLVLTEEQKLLCKKHHRRMRAQAFAKKT